MPTRCFYGGGGRMFEAPCQRAEAPLAREARNGSPIGPAEPGLVVGHFTDPRWNPEIGVRRTCVAVHGSGSHGGAAREFSPMSPNAGGALDVATFKIALARGRCTLAQAGVRQPVAGR